MKKDDVFYNAMLARDPRFDGKFFVGVKTTGIYCRPICPAKPKRENVEFFSNHLAAEQAGYRPCLRCRPESAPQSPAWIGKSALVRRAIKTIDKIETLEFNEDQFAELFGVSARHLRRLFIEEVGKTPKQLSFENRLNLARQLITETALPVTEVAFAAGFNSIRRFNDAFKERFKKSPSEIRRKPVKDKSTLSIRLSYRPPFDFNGLLHFYRSHAVGQLEWFEEGLMHRIIEVNGKVGQITLSDLPDESCIKLEIDFPDTTALHTIISRVRSLLDLDSDPVIIANVLETDKDMKALLKKHPGIRLPSSWDPFEVVVAAILGQVVSVERGRALVNDLIELAGSDSGLLRDGKSVRLFPTPAQVMKADLKDLKTTTRRKETLVALSKALVKGELSLEPAQDVDSFVEKILGIPGIGPWTASYMALKALRHTDAFPTTDLIIARAIAEHPKTKFESFSPWRGYVAALLWREYSQVLKKTGRKK